MFLYPSRLVSRLGRWPCAPPRPSPSAVRGALLCPALPRQSEPSEGGRRRLFADSAVGADGGGEGELQATGKSGSRPRRRLFADPDDGSDDAPPAAALAPAPETQTKQPSPLAVAALPEVRIWVFWDIDNKHPEGADAVALVSSLRAALSQYGDVQSVTAVGNLNSFTWVPRSITRTKGALRQLKQQEVQLALDERSGGGQRPYSCQLCGRRFVSVDKLQSHFLELHQRERDKQERFSKQQGRGSKARTASGGGPYAERFQAAREAAGLTTLRGYGLLQALNRASVVVVEVPALPQASDNEISRLARALVTRLALDDDVAGGGHDGPALAARQCTPVPLPPQPSKAEAPAPLDCLCIISDDSGFNQLLSWAADQGWSTLAVCSRGNGSFARAADVVLPWDDLFIPSQPGPPATPLPRAGQLLQGASASADYDDDDDDELYGGAA